MPAVRQLPAEPSSFVGREAELAAIGAVLGPGRLVTLTGPGGCGKTRLAIRVCGDDAVWVALEDQPGQVAERVAAALDLMLPAGADPVPALAHALRERELLLVLDNCEHVLDEAARLASALVAQCPGVGLLATSRAALGIAGERVWTVPPMDLADALALFCERAGVDSDRTGARRVCDRLDRLPLALELAAGWADTLSPAQIADSLQDPYQLLDGGARTAPFRQQTLEGSMRWSHDLLDDAERVLFRRLGVFEPGFTADDVAELSDGVLKALRGLIAKSLLVADTSGPVARYRMLGVIRDYALARLAEAGETEQVRTRHLGIQLALVDRLAPLLDADKDDWRARIGPSYSNIRAAIEWGLGTPDPTLARRLAAGVAWLWHLEGRGDDGIRLLRLAMRPGERSALQARVLVSLALVADTALPGGEGYESARQAADLASELLDEPSADGLAGVRRLARSLAAIGLISSDLEAARAAAAEVRDEAAAAGDGFVTDASAALVGLVHLLRDEYGAAIEQLEPAIDGLLRRGDRGVGSSALCWLAQATGRAGDLRRAAELAGRAVAAAEPLRDFHRVGSARAVLAETLVRQGDPDAAAETLDPIDRLVAGLDRPPFIPGWERTHARLELARGAPGNAADWCRREPGRPPAPETQLVLAIAMRESGSDPAEQLEALAASPVAQQMPRLRAAVLSEHAAGADTEHALDLHHEALRIRVDHDLTLDCIDSLDALARLYLRRGAAEPAALLFGAAEQARTTAGAGPSYQRPDGLDPDLVERGRTMSLPAAAGYAARSRGRRKRPDSGWDSLTPTERSVVELAVQGLSNPDIAARLFVTRGTVKTHLAHVYAKLHVANRTELARLAGEQD